MCSSVTRVTSTLCGYYNGFNHNTYLMEKYTKRASARIIKEVLKFRDKVSGNTTYDQAFVILMEAWDLECGVVTSRIQTKCDIYRDKESVHTFEWGTDVFNKKSGDWDWDFIYKTVLEHIIKTRLYKRPKTRKSKPKK